MAKMAQVKKAQPKKQKPAAPNERLYISFLTDINPVTASALMGTIGQHMSQNPGTFRELHLLLSTMGGQVAAGISLYNMLMGLPVRLITHNTGAVNSIGNVVFLAGTERYAAKVSSFMFHGVGFDVQNQRFEEKLLVEKLDSLRSDQDLIADIIVQRTKIRAKEVKDLFLQAGFLRANEAKARGIIDDIRQVKVPKGAPFLQLVFK